MSLPGIGLFGTGPAARVLVPYLRQEGFQVEAVWGLTQSEADEAALRLNIGFSTNKIDDVLLHKDVGLVMILCVPAHHSEVAVKALGIGKHVYVQPPASISQNETLRMVQASAYYPSLISGVGHGLRFLPAFVRMKAMVQEGYLGPQVTYCDVKVSTAGLIGLQNAFSWACSEAMGGGALNQLGCHAIDLLYFLTGLKATKAMGCLRTLTASTASIKGIRSISSDDVAVFQLETDDSDCLCTVSLRGHDLNKEFSQEVLLAGPRGQLYYRNGKLTGHKSGLKEEVICNDDEWSGCLQEAAGEAVLPDMYLKGYSRLFRHLADTFLQRRPKTAAEGCGQPASFEDALYVAAVIEAVRMSSKDKRWTRIHVDRV